jgi:hypothetical protein
MIIRCHGLLLFKIHVSLLVQALQVGDEIKRLLDTKSDEITFFQGPQKPYEEAKFVTIITMGNHLSSWLINSNTKKGYF